jgi:hypothetical protein
MVLRMKKRPDKAMLDVQYASSLASMAFDFSESNSSAIIDMIFGAYTSRRCKDA